MRKLAAYSETASHYDTLALTATLRIEELNKKGQIQWSMESVWRQTTEDGKRYTQQISLKMNDKDTLQGEQKRQLSPQSETNATTENLVQIDKNEFNVHFNLASPFDPLQQAKYRFVVLGQDEKDPAKLWLGYFPQGKASLQSMIGRALVDPTSGRIIRAVERPSENPPHVDQMEITKEYGAPAPYGTALSCIEMKGEGGFLFFKKRFRATMVFSDHQFGERGESPAPSGP